MTRNRNLPPKQNIPAKSKPATTTDTFQVQLASAKLSSGPIPEPEVLEHYDKIQQGFAERIVVMAEKQANHRMSMEKTSMANDKNMFKFGNICAIIVVFAIMATACWIATFDPKCATVFGGVGLAAIVGVFIWRGHQSNKK